jgi:hypothetical protein
MASVELYDGNTIKGGDGTMMGSRSGEELKEEEQTDDPHYSVITDLHFSG